jgi:AsmA protein
LSTTPDVVLSQGVGYVYGSSSAGAQASNIVLDNPVLTFNAAGLAGETAQSDIKSAVPDMLAPVIEQISSLAFDRLLVRGGTVHITAADGTVETMTDVQAEVTGRKKGVVAARGTFSFRGQRVAFDATVGQPADKKQPLRWPFKAAVKGALLTASFDGHVDLAADVQLTGEADVSTPNLRRVGRWFSLPLHSADGFNEASAKGQFTWARRSLEFEKVKVTVDGNEGNGRLALNTGGDRPQIDATLDFASLNLGPYIDSTRALILGFDLPSGYWSGVDLSLPSIRHVDADLRISARKVMLKQLALGRGGATITAKAGKLQADLTELELHGGTASGQVMVIMSEAIPRYAVRGKLENIDAGTASAQLFGGPGLMGRATATAELTSTGYAVQEIIRRLSGRIALIMPEGRAAVDLKTLGQTALSDGGQDIKIKASAPVEKLEAKALIIDGVAFADSIRARVGSKDVSAFGRAGLADGNMDARVVMKTVPAAPTTDASVRSETITVRGPWQSPVVRSEDADVPTQR